MKYVIQEDIQAHVMQAKLTKAAREQQTFGPEEGRIVVQARNVAIEQIRQGVVAIRYCFIDGELLIVEGHLPQTIPNVTVGQNVIWNGDVDTYLPVIQLCYHTNGRTELTGLKIPEKVLFN